MSLLVAVDMISGGTKKTLILDQGIFNYYHEMLITMLVLWIWIPRIFVLTPIFWQTSRDNFMTCKVTI